MRDSKNFTISVYQDTKNWNVEGYIFSLLPTWTGDYEDSSGNTFAFRTDNISDVNLYNKSEYKYLTEYNYINRDINKLHDSLKSNINKYENRYLLENCSLVTRYRVNTSDIGTGYNIIKVIIPYEILNYFADTVRPTISKYFDEDTQRNCFMFIHGFVNDGDSLLVKYTINIKFNNSRTESRLKYRDYIVTLIDVNNMDVSMDDVFIDAHINDYEDDHDSQMSILANNVQYDTLLTKEFYKSHINRTNGIILSNNISDVDGSLYYIGDLLTKK